MKIGNTELKHGLILAPMAGVSDYTMRTLCHDFGCEMSVTEMLSAKAIHFGDEKTETLAKFDKGCFPCSIQIFGHEPEIMAEAAKKLADKFSPVAIDINMGCPVKKITSNGEGSSLMRDPELSERIVHTVADAINIPVTVKIRAGWDEQSKNAVEFAQRMEAAGASAIAVHGRTKSQMYTPGTVDLDIIRDVKRAVTVPVIGNGDIYTAEDALRMYEYTGCDGIMPARGVYGNPWIFTEITSALEGNEYTPPSLSERMDMSKKYLYMMIEDKGEYTGIREARTQLAWFIKGLRGAAQSRVDINRAETFTEVCEILNKIADNNN
ncbi:MAG: tRNA dihydrouridine synthase DusB [Ruminococcaceae bacterium]|nr:tRNA dihydrouridine synthase DusB [Oscillospiraceae bacterium]